RGSGRREATRSPRGGRQLGAPDAKPRLAVTGKGTFVDHVQLPAPLVNPGRLELRQEATARDVLGGERGWPGAAPVPQGQRGLSRMGGGLARSGAPSRSPWRQRCQVARPPD